MTLNRIIKLANKIEQKHLTKLAEDGKIDSAELSCETELGDDHRDYIICLSVSGSINGKPFNYSGENEVRRAVSAGAIENISELAEELDNALNSRLYFDKIIDYTSGSSPKMMSNYVNSIDPKIKESWLDMINRWSKKINSRYLRNRMEF